MTLQPHTKLGQYEILAAIGKGGMGEVYRARDAKLQRDVAIKILPEDFAQDPERVARFQREAQMLAALNHPGIGMIHDLQQSGSSRFLVLELIEGETLGERIARGPLPIDEALRIAMQIAEAVEAAHERGIIHRDLKPANIKVTTEDRVKVLDFGLAKIRDSGQDGNISQSPTLMSVRSEEGVILGTAAYMSPEQARGKHVDRRADIWAFGCVLYEMLTGQQAFGGDTVTDILAKIIRGEPNKDLLPAGTPIPIRDLLFRCLNKDPHHRLQHLGDARIEIAETLSSGPSDKAIASRPRLRNTGMMVLAAVILATVVTAFTVIQFTRSAASKAVMFYDVGFGESELAVGNRPEIALSPDGKQIVYSAFFNGGSGLMIRNLSQSTAKAIAGAENGQNPFFSPDGKWIGFWANQQLRKIPVGGGGALTICEGVPDLRGAAWGPNDVIIFTPSFNLGLWKVPAAGGKPEMITKPDRSKGEKSHRFPNILPDGKAVVFTIGTSDMPTFDDAKIAVKSLETGEQKLLINGGSAAKYLPTGHLLYARGGMLYAVRFDPRRLEVIGAPIAVVNGVATADYYGVGEFDFAADSLLYLPGPHRADSRRLVWVDRHGTVRSLIDTVRPYIQARISSDGQRIAVALDGGNNSTWLYHLGRETFSPLTQRWDEYYPVWSPDGKRLAFASDRDGEFNIYVIVADGNGETERLTTSDHTQLPYSWSPDGQFIAFTEFRTTTGLDILVLPMQGDHTPRVIAQRPANESGPVFSPDGKWLAFTSNESGRSEVWIQPFPGPGERIQISTDGGIVPIWSPKGGELFYQGGGKVMVVDVTTTSGLTAKPRVLFNVPDVPDGWLAGPLDVSRDGQYFVMNQTSAPAKAKTLQLVVNWIEDLKKQMSKTAN